MQCELEAHVDNPQDCRSFIGTSDVINVKQQIAAGQLNATNAVNILDDLLNNQLSDGQTATAAFSMASAWLCFYICSSFDMSRSRPSRMPCCERSVL